MIVSQFSQVSGAQYRPAQACGNCSQHQPAAEPSEVFTPQGGTAPPITLKHAPQMSFQTALAATAASTGISGAVLAGMIDHTLLKPDATADQIKKLCAEAREHQFASVCVQPGRVELAAAELKDSPVMVCTVVGFPHGATSPEGKAAETRQAIADGANEIDMVINVGALKSGDLRLVEQDIEGVADACRACGVTSKVIIEAALLTDEEKITACTLSKAAGADFVKTSTGFGPGGATVADVALMRRVVGVDMGVKAAGGVRDYEQMQAMVAAGATRVGASAGVRIVRESQGGASPVAAATSGPAKPKGGY